MSLPDPIVSILIVAADSGASLRECVTRALASSGVAVEVIVIDNASRDGKPQAIEREYANDVSVRVLYNDANLGFGPAANHGAKLARGEALLVLNPDCLLEPYMLARLLGVLQAHPDAGMIGAVMFDEQGQPDPASRRRDPLLRRALMTMTGLAKREAQNPKYAGVNVPGTVPRETVGVENISGALMLIPRKVFEKLGGFDEGYFLHCEDLDLCRRTRDAGYKVLLAGNVRMLHGKGGSSRHRPAFVSRHKHRGMWRWFRKFDPASRNPFTCGLVWCGIWIHFVFQLPQLIMRKLAR
ncbi:MAG: glycosyltransferase family 2 protein [Pseudomonadota bacterium]|nr:glycosyltransferase family 2 protein [Pseudomonadota bacterium]